MEKVRTFFGSALEGRLVHRDPDGFELYMKQFEDGKEIQIEIKPFSKRRTSGKPWELTNFNGYYWAIVVRKCADAYGELNQKVMHGIIQIGVGNLVMSKEGKEIPKGTDWMSGWEFSEYCARCRTWASIELGIYIPEPHEYGERYAM